MITVSGAGVSQTATIMCAGAVERALGWESADLSSRPGFVTTELSDLGQVTSSLSASFLFSKIQGGGGARFEVDLCKAQNNQLLS